MKCTFDIKTGTYRGTYRKEEKIVYYDYITIEF